MKFIETDSCEYINTDRIERFALIHKPSDTISFLYHELDYENESPQAEMIRDFYFGCWLTAIMYNGREERIKYFRKSESIAARKYLDDFVAKLNAEK